MKIAFCSPCHSRPEMEFAVNWLELAVFTSTALRAEVKPFAVTSSDLCANREGLTRQALEWGADYLLYADTDQTFPQDAVVHLLKQGKQAIGANYPRRTRPTGPTAAKIVDGRRELVWTTPELAEAAVVERVAHLGLGFCLIAASALAGVQRPLFVGPAEDTFFFDRLAAAGVEVYLDHALSWHVGHIMTERLTNQHALMDRAQYELRRSHGAEMHNLPVRRPA